MNANTTDRADLRARRRAARPMLGYLVLVLLVGAFILWAAAGAQAAPKAGSKIGCMTHAGMTAAERRDCYETTHGNRLRYGGPISIDPARNAHPALQPAPGTRKPWVR
jgi:hypothetical protein